MILAASLKSLLEAQGVPYRVFQHRRIKSLQQIANLLDIDPACILNAQLLEDTNSAVLVVHKLDTRIDVEQLKKLLNRNLTVPAVNKINRLFKDCDAGCWPPIGQAYGIETIIDKSIEKCRDVYFVSGSNTSIVQLKADDFIRLNRRAKILSFTHSSPLKEELNEHRSKLALPQLPSLPPVVLQVLQLVLSSQQSIDDLANSLAQNSALQQQILLYARQPYQAMDQIVIVAANNQVESNNTKDLWLHALYASRYAERITHLIAPEYNLDPAISYMAGLFHNIGLLLFSQLFPPEYTLLRKWMRANPKVSIALLEKRLLGMGAAFNILHKGHSRFGEALLRHWHMPEPICVVAKEHHSLTYQGDYSAYVKIIQLTNQVLKSEGIGDGTDGGVNTQQLEQLGLTQQEVMDSLNTVKSGSISLDMYAIIASCIGP